MGGVRRQGLYQPVQILNNRYKMFPTHHLKYCHRHRFGSSAGTILGTKIFSIGHGHTLLLLLIRWTWTVGSLSLNIVWDTIKFTTKVCYFS